MQPDRGREQHTAEMQTHIEHNTVKMESRQQVIIDRCMCFVLCAHAPLDLVESLCQLLGADLNRGGIGADILQAWAYARAGQGN